MNGEQLYLLIRYIDLKIRMASATAAQQREIILDLLEVVERLKATTGSTP